MGNNILDLF